MASYGPVSLVVISFPGNEFRGEIAPALGNLIESGTIRVIDIVFVAKDEDGNVLSLEMSELGEEIASQIDPVVSEVSSLLGEDDIAQIAELLEPNSSAAMLLFENAWASTFTTAVRNANGEVLMHELIPAAVVNAVAEGELDV
jgi:uncharacterized membrane protein